MYLKGPLVILGQEQQKTSGVLASPTQPPSILLPDLVMSMGQTCWTVEAPDHRWKGCRGPATTYVVTSA